VGAPNIPKSVKLEVSGPAGMVYYDALLQTFPGQSLSRTDVSRTSFTKDFHVHNVCKYQLCRLVARYVGIRSVY